MALLTRRRRHRSGPPPAPGPESREWTWYPVTGEVIACPPAAVEDDGAAGTAWAVCYQTGNGPATAILTAWTYPVYAGPDAGGFVLGRCWEHTVSYLDGRPPWRWLAWEAAGEDQSVYRDLDDAIDAAGQVAAALASSGFTGGFPGEGITGFGWDGTPC